MKILEIIPSLQVGGAEKFTADLSNEFAKNGHQVILVTLFAISNEDTFGSLSSKVKKMTLNKKSGFDLNCMWNLYKLIKAEKPDIVHAHLEAVKYLLLPTLLYKKTKYFATIHSDAMHDSGVGFSYRVRKFLYKSHLLTPITISKASQKSFLDVFGIETQCIENGCAPYNHKEDVSAFRDGVDYLFVHAASIQPVKNQIMLVKAFSKLCDEYRNIRLLMLGRACNNVIESELKKYESDKICLLGQMNNVRDYMAIADAFCLSSKIEGMPITLIEAFSTGCIPIVTPAGGCVDMIENRINGFISTDITEEAYFSSLNEFMHSSTAVKAQIKENCLRTFETRYSIESCADSYISSFSGTISR